MTAEFSEALKAHQAWLERNGEGLTRRSRQELEEDLGCDGFGALRNLAGSLDVLAQIDSRRFLTEIEKSTRLDCALAPEAAGVQIALMVFLREQHSVVRIDVPTGELDRTPLLIATCFLRGLSGAHRQLVLLQRNLLDVFPKMIAVAQRFNASEPFRFVYELECQRDGVVPNSSLVDARETLGPYWPLLAWKSASPEEFGQSLDSAATHRMSLITMTDDRMAPLDYAPFDLFPVELLYVIELRKGEGLALPEITHPLLTPWLNFEYAQGPLPADEWVERVRTKCTDYGIEIVLD